MRGQNHFGETVLMRGQTFFMKKYRKLSLVFLCYPLLPGVLLFDEISSIAYLNVWPSCSRYTP